MKKQIVTIALILLFASSGLPVQPLHAQGTIGCESSVVVRAGDSLSAIAGQQLGNLAAYNQIVDATNAQAATDASYATISNPNVLNVGWKLCIPAASTSGATSPETISPETIVLEKLVFAKPVVVVLVIE